LDSGAVVLRLRSFAFALPVLDCPLSVFWHTRFRCFEVGRRESRDRLGLLRPTEDEHTSLEELAEERLKESNMTTVQRYDLSIYAFVELATYDLLHGYCY
jgi:hypothetical protein